MSSIRVSVITPAFNAEPFIAETIRSVQKQTLIDLEHIVIDDGSSDRTAAIVAQLAERDPRIVLLRNETNLGLIHSPNRGMAIARGEFIARLDADDLWSHNKLAAQVAYLDAHPEVVALGSQAQKFGNASGVLTAPLSAEDVRMRLFFDNSFRHSSFIWRADWLRTRNIQYREEGGSAEDYDLWVQIVEAGGAIVNLPYKFLYYRIHEKSETQSKRAILLKSANEVKYRQWARRGVRLSAEEKDLIEAGVGNYDISTQDIALCRGLRHQFLTAVVPHKGWKASFELGRFFSNLMPRPQSTDDKIRLAKALRRIDARMAAVYVSFHLAGRR